MAISIGSDLVLGVVNAANPQRLHLARSKLKSADGATMLQTNFGLHLKGHVNATTKVSELPMDLISDVINSADQVRLTSAISRLSDANGTAVALNDTESWQPKSAAKINLAGKVASANSSNQKFEAMVLRSFVEDMMPKSTSDLYGDGTAGEVWRSMQADFMSQEIAKAGGIGIAKQLDAQDQINRIGISPHRSNRDNPNGNDHGVPLNADRSWPYFRLHNQAVERA